MADLQAAIDAAAKARKTPCSSMANTGTIQGVRRQIREAVYGLYNFQIKGTIPKDREDEVDAEIAACYERSRELKEILRQRSLDEAIARGDHVGEVAAGDCSDDGIL